jgi:hypothetical protein
VVVGGAFAGVTLILFFLLFPTIGRYVIRTRVLPKVADKLGRDVHVGSIRVGYGEVTLEGIRVSGPLDDAAGALLEVKKVRADFDFWPALFGRVRIGTVEVEGARATLARDSKGADNWSDVLARVRGRGAGDGGGGGKGGGMMPRAVVIKGASVVLVDDDEGVRVEIARIDGHARRQEAAHLDIVEAMAGLSIGPRVTAGTITFHADLSDPARPFSVNVQGGAVSLIPTLSLTGITGRISSAHEPGRALIKFEGGYGGVPGTLWTAEGWTDPGKLDADLHLRADRFTLDKLAQVLAGTPIKEPETTSISAQLDVTVRGGDADFAGGVELQGLNLEDVRLAEEPVRDLGLTGDVSARYERRARTLTVNRAAVKFRGIDAVLDGFAALPGGRDEGMLLGRKQPRGRLHLVIPEVPCQQALDAIPKPLAPRLQGFKLKGPFQTDVVVEADWADLEQLKLDGSVGLFKCKVIEPSEPMDAKRLLDEFEHWVEVEENNWISFIIGPSNPDFVPLVDVSPNLINSLMTTEDNGFYKHKGFIVREFKSALIKNLQEGQKQGKLIVFKFGASSITMQMVKNVLLQRQKTVSRKLQELFLTWYVEVQLAKEYQDPRLAKDRIMEIYVNAIEFGPGIYGIGPAARHYFGKHPRDLNPVESAFFSSILPNPKQRYMQYCEGELSRWGDAKVQRILKTMHQRERLTDDEYQAALGTPLLFDRSEALPEKECKDMTRRMIKRTRPTTPGVRPEGPVVPKGKRKRTDGPTPPAWKDPR